MSPTRIEATAARKRQIIEAAIALLAGRGYAPTTFDAICETAGLSSKRLISYHFASKDDLLGAVSDHVVELAETFMRPSLDAAGDYREILAAAIRSNVAFIAAHPAELRALQQIVQNRQQAWDPRQRESIRRLTGLFRKGQRAGLFRRFDPRVMATVLRAALDSTYEPITEGLSPVRCANQLVEIFDRATRADPAPGGGPVLPVG